MKEETAALSRIAAYDSEIKVSRPYEYILYTGNYRIKNSHYFVEPGAEVYEDFERCADNYNKVFAIRYTSEDKFSVRWWDDDMGELKSCDRRAMWPIQRVRDPL